MVKMDIVMVSDSTKPGLMQMTQQAVDSIAADDVNTIVLEKSPTVKYNNADTFLQKQPFNYNQCLNDGALMGNAEFICFTNNDVVFPEGFVKKIRSQMSEVRMGEADGFDVLSVRNQHGYIHPEIISGFCFVMRRSAWNKIGKLKTDYKFWCADNVTSEQIKEHGLKEFRSDIRVTHLTSVSLKHLDDATREDYTRNCVKRFNKDYNKNVLNMGK